MSTSTASPTRNLAAPIALAALAVLAYANTFANRFVFDDGEAVLGHPVVTGRAPFLRVLSLDFWGGARAATFRPLVTASFRLDWVLGGGAPWMFHATNVALHAACVVALWMFLAGRRDASARASWIAAALFAVHPIGTEAVASIVGRGDVAATLLVLLAARSHTRAPTRAGVAIATFAFLAALLCKESALATLPLFALIDRSRDAPERASSLVARWGGLVLAVVVAFALRYHALGTFAPPAPTDGNALRDASALTRVLTGLGLYARGLGLLVWPQRLLPDYGAAVVHPTAGVRAVTVVGAVALAALALTVARAVKRRDASGDGAVLLLVPGAVAVGLVMPLPVAFAERWWYLPAAGACAMVGLGLDALGRRVPSRVAHVLVSAVIVACGTRTLARNRDWHDERALWSAAIRDEPESAMAHYSIGSVLDGEHRDAEALEHFRIAATLATDWAEPHAAAAVILARSGRMDEAAIEFEAMRAAGGASARARRNYVRFLRMTNRLDEARRELDALQRDGARSGRRPGGGQ